MGGFLSFFVFACGSLIGGDSLHAVVREDIFRNPPFASCHAPTLSTTGTGDIIAAWFGGDHEGSDDTGIWASIRSNGKWSVPAEIANGLQEGGIRQACWNPVLFLNAGHILYLYYKVGADPRHWRAFFKTSTDQGRSWSPAQKLPAGFLGPIKNKPVQLLDGDILYPSSVESPDGKSWTAHMERTDSKSANWSGVQIPSADYGIIQPALLKYKDGRLQALFRSRQNVIAQSWSEDQGRHWSAVTSLGLPNPNSGIDALSLRDGLQLLVYNPLASGENWWNGRSVLKVALSADGKNWRDAYTLEAHPTGEFSYPCVIEDHRGSILIAYTAERKTIRFVELRF